MSEQDTNLGRRSRLVFTSAGAQWSHQRTQRKRFVLGRQVIREVHRREDLHDAGLADDDTSALFDELRRRPRQRLWLVHDSQAPTGASLLITGPDPDRM